MINRQCKPLLSHSFFLFGARGTGKTTLLKQYLPGEKTLFINLLLPSDYDDFALRPETLVDRVRALPTAFERVVIDEVQKIFGLLDIVHYLVEETKLKFALTGSSARKLKKKRGG